MKKMILLLAVMFCFSVGGEERPNILWLTCEDNSASWVGCYGNLHVKTPNIDRLASEGFQYMNAFANAPVCSPSRGTWITGVLGLSMGIQPMRSRNEIPHDLIRYYPDYLNEAGYYTGNDGKTDYNIGGRDDGDCWTKPGKVDWDAMKTRQPFFQVINTAKSHESRAFGEVDNTRFDPANAVLAKYHPDIPGIRMNYAKYADQVENMDMDIGASLQKLDEMGLRDNTIVIYNSDHGGVMPRSKRFLYASSLHCPLIIRIPEKFKHLWPAKEPGMKVDRLVSFVDMPKTWLSLTGVEIPSYMDGKIFLGPGIEPEQPFHYGFSGRQGERLDNNRSICDKRYYFVKQYMPYVPTGQYARYLWIMKATQAWDAHHKAGKTDEITGRFFRAKAHSEELYDMLSDPDCVNNLIEDAAYGDVASRMRRSLRQWQESVYDSGLMPEADRAKRAAEHGLTIYEMVRDPKLYNLKAYLDAADIALEKNRSRLPELIAFLDDEDSALRYWGVIGCLMLGEQASKATEQIKGMLTSDDSHDVRAMAAWHLIRIGEKEEALDCLEDLLRANSYAMLKVLSVIHWIGEDGRRFIGAIKAVDAELLMKFKKMSAQKEQIVLQHLKESATR